MRKIRLSDVITTTRIFIATVFSICISFRPQLLGLVPGLLIIAIIFFSDVLDGIVARKLKEHSEFGAFYDIVGDRIAEITLLIPFVFLKITTPIPLVYFVVKGFLTDYRRFYQFVESKAAPLKQASGKLGQFLQNSGFMRQMYMLAKLTMISLFYLQIFSKDSDLKCFSDTITWITIFISVIRTIPSYLVRNEAE